jgi:hypothetical protein
MSEFEQLKQVEPEVPKTTFLKGKAESPGGMRLVFSIDSSKVLSRPELLELILDEMTTLLNIAALDTSIGIDMLQMFRSTNESLQVALGGAPEVYQE